MSPDTFPLGIGDSEDVLMFQSKSLTAALINAFIMAGFNEESLELFQQKSRC